ncbi:DUF1800 family protein [Sneathiella sp. P13V-1]|uniref:DUF1800 domain-containing protein n=1 Tax=Sneathiella sp. P13V-1 TaxID=2697366 RepID=UPI00187B462D|nr:DUF1800 domain-containing protein [Sneathiella sp. P13V-1]MBE7635549.1 DUF1800 family protein [Sneathiella sp. P13V-1]
MQDETTFIALNRFGLGAQFGEGAVIGREGCAWLEAQITPAAAKAPMLDKFLPSDEIMKAVFKTRFIKDQDEKKSLRKTYRQNLRRELAARLQYGIETNTPFAERLVYFWSNHFTISGQRPLVGLATAAYEREAIRPHVFGRFEDLLLSATRHVGMLIYLDNAISVGPNSRAGKRRGRSLNENLAREILELHTLGVRGGYNQQDVTEFAKALTGWSHGALGGKRKIESGSYHGGFEFYPNLHEPGAKTILGKRYGEEGEQEVVRILKDLARHPSTARFIATKLCRHFIADNPPARAVDKLVKVYMKTDGDLPSLYRALVSMEEAWQPGFPKMKTPYELLLSIYRLTGTYPRKDKQVTKGLVTLGHVPFNADSPQGWADTEKHWLTPEALMRRIEWGQSLSRNMKIEHNPARYFKEAVGDQASDEAMKMVAGAETASDGMALLFASAEFQRR